MNLLLFIVTNLLSLTLCKSSTGRIKSHLEIESLFQDFTFPNFTSDDPWRFYAFTDKYTLYWRVSPPLNKINGSFCGGNDHWLNQNIEILAHFSDFNVKWFGVGFGSSNMLYSDAIYITKAPSTGKSSFQNPKLAAPTPNGTLNSENFAIFDISIITGPLILDSDLQMGRNDLDFGTCHDSMKMGVLCYTKRNFFTGDIMDHVIRPGPIPVIYAFSFLEYPNAHGPLNRDAIVIEFYSCTDPLDPYEPSNTLFWDGYGMKALDSLATTYPKRKWRDIYFFIFHGGIMLVTWLVSMPLGFLMARNSQLLFEKFGISWLAWHKLFMGIGSTEVITVSLLSYVTGSQGWSVHGNIGLAIAISFLAQISTGFLAERFIARKVAGIIHVTVGSVVWVLGLVNIVIGFQLVFSGGRSEESTAWIVLSALLFVVLMSFLIFPWLLGRFGRIKAAKRINPKNGHLPRFTLAQVMARSQVSSSDKRDDSDVWVLVGSNIYSVLPSTFNHPGGFDIIRKNGGKDISQFFIERVNRKSKDLVHFHSRIAFSKLQTMLVGVLAKEEEEVVL